MIAEAQDERQRNRIQRVLEAVREGSNFADFGDELRTEFYILGLAPNAARLSVRFFHHSTVKDLLERLHEHHRCFRMVRQFTTPTGSRYSDPEFPAVWQILRETARVSDEIPPLLGGALTRAIIEGGNYPEALFTAILRRIHADRVINYLRAATLKAVLTRNHKLQIPIMLDPISTSSPYLHGRLFAVLEKVQEEGHYAQTSKQLKSTIKEKYFSSASARPAAVFPRLESLSVHHQRHLNPHRKVYFDKLLCEIKWPLDANEVAIKRIHSLTEQGEFILGYYHQRRALFDASTQNQLIEATTD